MTLDGSTVGTVVRVQLQRSRLKPRGSRRYDPAPLVEVPEAQAGPRGLREPGGVLDVHHADHPDSRNRQLANGLSVLPRAHYAALRARFGPHLVDGAAGESLLLDTPGPLSEADLAGTLLLETEEGDPLVLTGAQAAPPCVEFARWCLRRDDDAVDAGVREALAALEGGARGFYLQVQGEGRVARGARLTRA